MADSSSTLNEKDPVLVYGTGATSFGGFSSGNLLFVKLQVHNQQDCYEIYKKNNGSAITNDMICATNILGKDACQVCVLNILNFFK